MKGYREGSTLGWEKGSNGSIPVHPSQCRRYTESVGENKRKHRNYRLYETRVANSRNDNVVLGHLLRELAVPLEMRMEALRDNDQRRSWYQQRANQRQKMEDQQQENR